MFGRAVTLDRFTAKETDENRRYMFERWEDAFGKDCDEQLVELFVDEGSCGGIAVILYDGKNYWCPSYDQTGEARLNQWIHETGSTYLDYNQLTKEYYNADEHELNVLDWLESALDIMTTDEGHDEEYWGKHGTDVPLII